MANKVVSGSWAGEMKRRGLAETLGDHYVIWSLPFFTLSGNGRKVPVIFRALGRGVDNVELRKGRG